jgi:hypothetical protein
MILIFSVSLHADRDVKSLNYPAPKDPH